MSPLAAPLVPVVPPWVQAALQLAARVLAGRPLHLLCDPALPPSWCGQLLSSALVLQDAHAFGTAEDFLILGSNASFVQHALAGMEVDAASVRCVLGWQGSESGSALHTVFRDCWWRNVVQVMAVEGSLDDADQAELGAFTYFPYHRAGRCLDTRPVLVDTWRPETGWQSAVNMERLDARRKVFDLQGCPLRVTSFTLLPYHALAPSESGDGELALAGSLLDWFASLARSANFTPVFSIPPDGNGFWGSLEEQTGMFGDLLLNRTDLAFVMGYVGNGRARSITFETSVCSGFCLPELLVQDSLFAPLTRPFQPAVWLSLSLGCSVSTASLVLIGRLWRRHSRISLRLALSYVLSPLISRAPLRTPSAPSFRIMLAMLHCFGLVMASLYQAAWHSINAVHRRRLLINNVDEFMRYEAISLIMQKDTEVNLDLSDSFVQQVVAKATRHESDYRHILATLGETGAFATFVSESICLSFSRLHRPRYRLMFLSDRCIMQVPISFLWARRGSPYAGRLKEVATRLFESGLVDVWLDPTRRGARPRAVRSAARPLGFPATIPAFLVLGTGLALACAAWLGEVLLSLHAHQLPFSRRNRHK